MKRFAALAAGAVMGLALAGVAHSEDPKVPPGRDPGGVAVALISGGIDYAAADIAPRLARDGEGEIVGYDFIDDDRMPFDAGGHGTAIARTVLVEAPAARLAPLRASAKSPISLGPVAAFVAHSPARIVLVTLDGPEVDAWKPFRQAASRLDHLLFVVSAGDAGKDIDKEAASSPSLPLANLIVVTASDNEGNVAVGANFGDETVDVAAPGTEGITGAAAARVAALAARIAAEEPGLNGAGLKARVLALARPAPDGTTPFSRAGWIADPARGP